MKVDLISYRLEMSSIQKIDLTAELINSSESELMLFCGWALNTYDDVENLNKKIKNKDVCALLDVRECYYSSFCDVSNALFLLKNGVVEDMFTSQLFAESGEIEDNVLLGERFIDELARRRLFEVDGKTCMVLHCGELNILRNIQSQQNKVDFRFLNERELKRRFKEILSGVDIVLNPIHTPMGNQGKMNARRLYLSTNRSYFSTCNVDLLGDLNGKSVQYAMQNKKELPSLDTVVGDYNEYRKSTFEIL